MIRNILAATVTVVAALVFTAGTAQADVHQRGAAGAVLTDVTTGDPQTVAYALAGTLPANVYLFAVRNTVSEFHAQADDHSILGLGVSTCQALGRGVTVGQLLNIGLQNGFTSYETGAVMGAATSQLCPELAPVMRSELTALSN